MSEVVGYDHVKDIDKKALSELVAGHADWYADVQRNLGDEPERIIKKIRFTYKDAGVHLYKHGHEDGFEAGYKAAQKDME